LVESKTMNAAENLRPTEWIEICEVTAMNREERKAKRRARWPRECAACVATEVNVPELHGVKECQGVREGASVASLRFPVRLTHQEGADWKTLKWFEYLKLMKEERLTTRAHKWEVEGERVGEGRRWVDG